MHGRNSDLALGIAMAEACRKIRRSLCAVGLRAFADFFKSPPCAAENRKNQSLKSIKSSLVNFFNPAVAAFIETLRPARTSGQVAVARREEQYEVRHRNNAETPAEQLELLSAKELRDRLSKDAAGRFRPLRSAPDLLDGWRAPASSSEDLWRILNAVYPGALGDWHAFRQRKKNAVSFPEFAARQSGMFRVVAKLNGKQAQCVADACCDECLCLKQRLWSAAENREAKPPSNLAEPGLVCLEPCSLFLELARRSFKLGQAQSLSLQISEEECGLLLQALDRLAQENTENPGRLRAADFSNPANPRRIRLLRAQIAAQLPSTDDRQS